MNQEKIEVKKECTIVFKDDRGTIHLTTIPLESAMAYVSFVDANREVEAFLRHVATIPSMEQRYRLLCEWKLQMKVFKPIIIDIMLSDDM